VKQESTAGLKVPPPTGVVVEPGMVDISGDGGEEIQQTEAYKPPVE